MVEMPENHDGKKEIVCKLADFGFACEINPSSQIKLACGTPLYMAPEVVSGKSYDQKVDIWALGVIAFSMLTSEYPFNDNSRAVLHEKIKSKMVKPNYKLLNRYWQGGRLAKDFISHCLEKDPAKRWTAKQLLQHNWLKSMVAEPKATKG